MKIVFSNLALTDLRAIANYLMTEAGIDAALKVTGHIHHVIENTIFDNPKIGTLVDYMSEEKIRFFPADKYNIYYKSYPSKILVIRILHNKRNIRKILTKTYPS